MELIFTKQADRWVAEFIATADFNLHIEGVVEGNVSVFQRGSDSGNYAFVKEGTPHPSYANVYDYDFAALVYPKFIKVSCATEPTSGIVTSDGEITEIKAQSKEIEVTSNGTTEVTPDAGFAYLNSVKVKTNVTTESGDSAGGSGWTGHADAEGLRAIGWTDEDIAYYQEHGVNWNAEDDEYHKVSEDNKALYGVLTADNISSYKDRIVYLPKIDTSAMTNMGSMFSDCNSLVSIPQLDTSSVTNMSYMFSYCKSLISIPQLNTANVVNMNNMFAGCYSLVSIPQLDTQNVKDMSYMFNNCYSLVTIPQLDISSVTNMSEMFSFCYSLTTIPQLNTANVTNMGYMFNYCYSLVSIHQLDTQNVKDMSGMFYSCYSLVSIPQLDTSNVTNMSSMFIDCSSLASIPQLNTANVTDMSYMFNYCYSLTHANLKNAKLAYQLNDSALLSKESLLYLINNEAAASAITVTLHSYAYERLAEDADIVAALSNHPNISLASA